MKKLRHREFRKLVHNHRASESCGSRTHVLCSLLERREQRPREGTELAQSLGQTAGLGA